MIINFEFFDEEPIENVITCLHYKFDKVVFFGEKKVLDGKKDYTEKFLRNHCNVKTVSFVEISASNPNKVVETMQSAIEHERKQGNACYFDITGGEGLSLFAFGAVSKELRVPVHMYDVRKDELSEFNKGNDCCISKNVPSQHIHLNLDKYIEMHGGKINKSLNKSIKQRHSTDDLRYLEEMWQLSKRFSRCWNQFTNLLANCAQTLTVNIDAQDVSTVIANLKLKGLDIHRFETILQACAEADVIHDYSSHNSHICFSYGSDFVMHCMCDSGTTLEQYTYMSERNNPNNSDYRIGEHIDWDGVFHPYNNDDVENEIDVLSLCGNIPTFISCKNGTPNQHAMYELETVTDRFGGKYARKVLVTTKRPSRAHMLRAEEMGIEIKVL